MSTALVVGASGTLGGAIARELGARGYSLALHCHTHVETCEALAAELKTGAGIARCFAADFTDSTAPAALAASMLREFPQIDAIVWASGIVRDAPVLTMKEEDLRAVLQIDLRAFFLTLKSFSRTFMKQKSGAVLALSSHAALAGRPGGTAYAMAHAGILALVKSAAREWGPLGIRVNALIPPFVPESGMGRAASPEFAAAAVTKRVLKNDVDGPAFLARFAADVLANPGISGQVLNADSRIAV